MAEELIFRTIIEAAESAKTLGEVKQSIKDINAELDKTQVGSQAYRELTGALGKTKAQVVDLREQVKALDPEKRFGAVAKIGSSIANGFAAAQAATALFGSESEDLLRVLTRVQAATALAQGLQGLAGFSKALTTAGIAMRGFALSNPFTAILAGVLALGTAIAALVINLDDTEKKIESLKKAAEDFDETMQMTDKFWQRRIKLAEAEGASIERITAITRQSFKQRIEDIEGAIKTQQALVDSGDEEAIKKLKELTEKKKDIQTEQKLFEFKIIDDTAKRVEEQWETREKLDEKRIEAEKKRAEQAEKDRIERLKRESEYEQMVVDRHLQLMREGAEIEKSEKDQAFSDQVAKDDEETRKFLEKKKQTAEDIKKLDKEIADHKKQLEHDVFEAATALGNTLFNNAIIRAEGNEKKERQIRKNQFNFNKAVALVEAAINGTQAVMAALKIPPPAGEIIAGIRAGVVAAQIASIALQRFPDSGGGGGASIEAPRGGGGASAPSIQPPSTTNINTNQQGDYTSFGQTRGEPLPLRAYVVETEITGKQDRIRSIKNKTTF